MLKKRILYLMHVHWGWIKQRPHFIAEYLADEYIVTVCFCTSFRSRSLNVDPTGSKIRLKKLIILPFGRFKIISALNSWLINKQLSELLVNSEIVWITHPDMYGAVINDLPGDTHVVYDCTDDALEFPSVASNSSIWQRVAHEEYLLLARSNTIFATSHYLKKKLLERYEIEKEIYVSNNAINIYKNNNGNDIELSRYLASIFSSKETKKIVYIGTISEWIDLEIIQKSVEYFSNITYVLIGPTEVSIPRHDRIIHHSPVEHKMIHKILELADAVIMPFHINELVLSVNPVKVYEYIYAAKPAIVARYKETEKFSDFVYLYKSNDEYLKLIQQVAIGTLVIKRDREDYLTYARQNTWVARVFEISKRLENIV